jgi:endonuclease
VAPLYDKPVRLLFKDMVQEFGLHHGEILTRERVLSWFKARYPKVKPATIAANLILHSTNAPSRVHYNLNPDGADDLFYQIDAQHYRLYDPATDPNPIYQKEGGNGPGAVIDLTDKTEGSEEPAAASEFAYEKDLQSFLSKNLRLIEPGLYLYEEEGITGIEFPAGGRSIDILALDKSSNFVVIELKVSRGYDRVVGQVLRYMAWIAKNLADPNQSVRGVIVAREISEDLLLASSRVPDIELYEYQMSVTLKRVRHSVG